MSISCPACDMPLSPKGLKPGQFKPKCPKCGTVFILVIPNDPDGTIVAKLSQEKNEQPKPASANQLATEPEPGNKAKAPDVTGDFTDPVKSEMTADGTAPEPGERPNAPDKTSDFTEEESPPVKEPAKQDEDIPEKLGGYEVMKVLGKGGMGAVLLGRQTSLDRKVALKIMHKKIAANPSFVARFTREAYAAAQLTHHNVVQIYDIGEDRGTHFFSMEYIAGKSLQELVKKEGKLDPEAAVGYVLQAARGLRYGHNQGMVHRDIKPDNLMVNDEGIVKVADLGLVKLPNKSDEKSSNNSIANLDLQDGSGRLTRVGSVMGTPSYMAPEQSTNSASVDLRADIYSLGCTLYVLLTGKTPFEGKTAMEVMSKHQNQPLVPPEAIVKRVPKSISGVLQKMMAKKPEDRYRNMDEVIKALEETIGVKSIAGVFNPSEEQADSIERLANQYSAVSKGGLRKILGLAFAALCILGIIVTGVMRNFSLSGGLLGLLVMTPIAYIFVQGIMSGSHLFDKFRQYVFGARIVDWLMAIAGTILLLASLFIFGWLWWWLGFAVLAVGLAFVCWFLTDRAEEGTQEELIDVGKGMLKLFRINGVEEDAVRQFVAKYAGDHWEPLYEGLFGYDAKLEARTTRKAEPAAKHATWREPYIAWFDEKIRSRQEEKERNHLEKVQASALKAEGLSEADAKALAGELANVMVSHAASIREASKAGKPTDLKEFFAVARASKRPPEGYNIAGIKLRSGPRLGDLIDPILGRPLRFLLGGAIMAMGLVWMHQTDRLSQVVSQVEKAGEKLAEGKLSEAGSAAKGVDAVAPTTAKRGLEFLPDPIAKPFRSYSAAIGGFLLLLSGVIYFGWKPSLAAVPGCLLCLFGESLGIPAGGPLPAWVVSTIAGGILILIGGRLLRG